MIASMEMKRMKEELKEMKEILSERDTQWNRKGNKHQHDFLQDISRHMKKLEKGFLSELRRI